MNEYSFLCEHPCRNTCTALTKALNMETAMVRFSEEVIQQCDDADIKEFMRTLARRSSENIINIMKKLNEVQARTQILDNISSTFDSPGKPPSNPY